MKRTLLLAMLATLPAGPVVAQSSSPATEQAAEDLERGASASFQALDGNADGRVSPEEAAPDTVLSEVFPKADRNADGFVDGEEYLRYARARARAQQSLPGG
jgi:hypothetical protein